MNEEYNNYKTDPKPCTPEELHQRALNGSTDDMVAWALCLKTGDGVARDKAEAVKWFEKAADAGNVEALYQLGRCAETGNGLPQDDEMAADYYLEAAELGHGEAQYSYAVCLQGGLGVDYDPREANQWLRRAAEQGVERARRMLEKEEFFIPDEDSYDVQSMEKEDYEERPEEVNAETVVPTNPGAYNLNKDTQVDRGNRTEKPQPVHTVRSVGTFISIMVVSGGIFGFLLRMTYGMEWISFSENFKSRNGYTIYLVILGIFFGILVGGILSGVYQKVNEPLPLFAAALVLPVLLVLLGGLPIAIWKVLWPIIVGVVKIIGSILLAIIIICIVVSFL